MIISSLHWFVATVLAVAVHLAGILWLSVASPDRRIVAETAGEGIVVTLGREARSAAQSARELDPEDSRSVDTVTEAKPARPQAAIDEALPEPPDTEEPAPAEAEQESARLADPEAATTAESPEPQAAEASSLVDAPAAEPEAAATPDAVRPVESAQVAEAPVQEDSAVSVQVADAAPVSPDAVAVQEAAQPDPSRDTTEPPEAASPQAAEPADQSSEVRPSEIQPSEIQPSEPVPTLAARDTPAAEPSEAPAAAREVESPTASSADVEAAELARSSPELQLEAVEPEPGPEQPVDVATARQPAPEVEQSFEPEVSEPAQPETVKLQELQERSGGTGVVARYAGVLKGWLQRNMHYPRAARLAGQEGDVVVRFVIDRQGNVQSVELESGSGFELLDREATEMIERGDPFPPMPEDMAGERLEVRVPVSFHVRDETLNKDLPPIYLE